MPTIKPANVPETGGGAKRFSLVPALAQQQMYQALTALKRAASKPAKLTSASGAEVAEIAICVALGEYCPVILASAEPLGNASLPAAGAGARTVRKGCKTVAAKLAEAHGGVLAAATVAAVPALLADAKAAALVCAGRLDGQHPEDCRRAFGFAARHKLPILYLVANRLSRKGSQAPDLRTLYAEAGIPFFSVDANDAIAAHRVATEALHNARHLRGPCVIEALTLPATPHGKDGSAANPLDLLRQYMERHGNWPL